MFKKSGNNTIKIVAERQLRKMLFVAFMSIFSSLISIENSYASSVNILYTVGDDTEPQNKYIREIREELVKLSCKATDFKLNESRHVLDNLGDASKHL